MIALRVEQVTKRFGGLLANDRVALGIEEGEIVGLIGPNGAGKTTLFNCITGFMRPDAGSVRFYGREITRAHPEQICRLGLARTWQLVRVFSRLSVLDNVMVGAFARTNDPRVARRTALRLLDLCGLRGREAALAGAVTLAEKKRLEIARALATGPRLLLLDEAMSGLTPAETDTAIDLLRAVHRDFRREFLGAPGPLTVCLVEHVMEVIMPLSQRVVVLDQGRVIASGAPADVTSDERVIQAYLGTRYRARSR